MKIRRPNRLKEYDYSEEGAYFITLCVKERKNLLRHPVGATIGRLSKAGEIVEAVVKEIPHRYPVVQLEHYVIMPNHIHLLLRITKEGGRSMIAPTLSKVVQQAKGAVTKAVGTAIWQRSFYDHVIRNQADYDRIWEYIQNNPLRWGEDRFFENERGCKKLFETFKPSRSQRLRATRRRTLGAPDKTKF